MTEAARRTRRSRARELRPSKAVEGEARSAESSAEPRASRDVDADRSELELARTLALAAPGVTLVGAIVVGVTVALGPAILVLAGGALFGTVAFFWASLRTLGGDAPLAEGFEGMSRRRIEAPNSPAERKRAALRGLKDLEFEHSLGKIDDDDYAELAGRYREEAKAILREIDEGVSPKRERAEEIVKSYLARRGITDDPPDSTVNTSVETPVAKKKRSDPVLAAAKDAGAPSAPGPESPARGAERASAGPTSARRACLECAVSNEPDAVFCKKCGARLVPVECLSCTTKNEPDAAFCKKCGKSLASSVEKRADGAE